MNSLPSQLREILRPLLPERAFLRRARGDETFVTNAPRFGGIHSESHSLRCREENGLLFISPGAEMLTRFELSHRKPDGFFCRSLLRFCGRPPCEEALSLFAVGVRLLEQSDENEARLYCHRVRNLAAMCLRKNLGGAYACALLAEKPTINPAFTVARAKEIHGLAGELAHQKYGSRSMNAMDIIEFLPEVFPK
jgi:hypothetical protein